MNTATTTTKTKTCDRCGQGGLTWAKSQRTGKFYLQETVLRRGYSGRTFRNHQPHKCRPALNTSAQERVETYPHAVYGTPVTVVENPATHEHTWHDWRLSPGSSVVGGYCFGCNQLQID